MRILRIVQSHTLPCHCFVGVYETYEGGTVQIIEEPGTVCGEPEHKPGVVVRSAPGHPPVADGDRPPVGGA